MDTLCLDVPCPANIVASTDLGQCGKTNVSWTLPIPNGCTVLSAVTKTTNGVVVTSLSTFGLGVTPLVATVTDGEGGVKTCNFSVTITDSEAPVARCQNVVLPLDATGHATLTAAQVNNGSSDNCAITEWLLSKSAFDCSNLGANSVTLTVRDGGGLESSCTATVNVVDTTAPVPNVASLPAVTAQCTVTLTPPTATDACAGTVTATTTDALTYSAPGDYTVHWTYTDAQANSATQLQTVRVQDTTAPVITVCPPTQTASVGSNCQAAVPDFTSSVAVSDNCNGSLTITQSPVAGTLRGVGVHPITVMVKDLAGNPATCETQFTVTPPVIAPPVLTAVAALPGGAFWFVFTNSPGGCVTFRVLATTDLLLPVSSWTVLGQATETPPGSGRYEFTDHNATNRRARFYKVVSP